MSGAQQNGSAAPVTTVVIGAGFSGICAAVRLAQAGIEEFVVLERADEVGGTWRDNTYPGVVCNVPSFMCSYSFRPNLGTDSCFPSGAAILAYLKDVAAEFEINRFIEFGQNVTSMRFDDQTHLWTVTTERGTYLARTVIMACGPLTTRGLPAVDDLDRFAGKIVQTEKWDHSYDFAGKRVAVIGTGLSAVQVVPELVKSAQRVEVFQRSASWIAPRPSLSASRYGKTLSALASRGLESSAMIPVWHTAARSVTERLCRRYLRREVGDVWLRRQLQPQTRLSYQSMLLSNNYFHALQAENCRLVTWPIARMSEQGIKTCEGVEHQFDVIVFATGCDAPTPTIPFPVHGAEGRSLERDWASGASMYKGVSVTGYPNLFFTLGSPGGEHSWTLPFVEAQVNYAVEAISVMKAHDVTSLDLRPDAQDEYNRSIRQKFGPSRDALKHLRGRHDGLRPSRYHGRAARYRKQLKTVNLQHYIGIGALPKYDQAGPLL